MNEMWNGEETKVESRITPKFLSHSVDNGDSY